MLSKSALRACRGLFDSDGEAIHYVIEGAIALEIEGLRIWELGTGDAVAYPVRERAYSHSVRDVPPGVELLPVDSAGTGRRRGLSEDVCFASGEECHAAALELAVDRGA